MTSLIVALCLSAPNVVFLSVDTLRADHVGCYGHQYDTTPNIDRFAAESLVFEDCVCEVPLTGPSFGSMLTSQYPRTTGTTRNGLRMPEAAPTVTETFRDAGYYTFCVQSNWTLKGDVLGLDKGFEEYEDDFHEKRWGIIKPERYADRVSDIALSFLDAWDRAKPLFCWIHYSDPHAPYRFHKDFKPRGKPRFLSGRRVRVPIKYDSEIAFTDHHLGRVLDALPRENTFVLFVADHGESLYEHDYLGHGRRIYQAGVRIPLILRGPGIEPGRTDARARAIDVGPTLLGMAGLRGPAGMLGMDLIHDAVPHERPRVIETYGGAVPNLPGAKALMKDRPPQRQGVLHNGWKLILNYGEPELFQLEDDPMETKNLANAEPDRVAQLKSLIESWDKAFPRRAEEETRLTEDDVRALESLGYLE